MPQLHYNVGVYFFNEGRGDPELEEERREIKKKLRLLMKNLANEGRRNARRGAPRRHGTLKRNIVQRAIPRRQFPGAIGYRISTRQKVFYADFTDGNTTRGRRPRTSGWWTRSIENEGKLEKDFEFVGRFVERQLEKAYGRYIIRQIIRELFRGVQEGRENISILIRPIISEARDGGGFKLLLDAPQLDPNIR